METPEVVLHTTKENIKYYLLPNDAISKHIIGNGYFEQKLVSLSDKIISQRNQSIVLDIGANIGTYSIPLAKNHPNKFFCAFEPLPFIYQQLCKNIHINNLSNIKPFELALSDQSGITVIERLPYNCGNIGGNSLDKKISAMRVREYLKITPKLVPELIQMKKLDDLEISSVNMIKIDVEGFELQVLQGATETIKQNNNPPIMFEAWVDPWYEAQRNKVISFLRTIGYNSFLFLGCDNIAFKSEEELIGYDLRVEKVI
jgi:FkbM family methyltransferase